MFIHSPLTPLSRADTLLDKPADDAEAIGDPYKTLFIARLVIFFPLAYSRLGRIFLPNSSTKARQKQT